MTSFLSHRAKAALLVVAVSGATAAAWVVHAARTRAPDASAAPCETGEACRAHAVAPGGSAAPVRGKPRMLVFSSQTCAVCERMAPRLSAAERSCSAEGAVMHVDVDDDTGGGLAALYGVELLPSFVSVDASGREVSRLVGLQPQERLEEALQEIRGDRCAATDEPVRERAL
jgi:thioredoxin-like negative regulator of GroEL